MREKYYLGFRGSYPAAFELLAGAALMLLGVLSDLSSLTAVGMFLAALALCVKTEER